jgi:Fibronectin type III domain
MRSTHRRTRRSRRPAWIVPGGLAIGLAIVLAVPGAALALFSSAPSQTASVTAATISPPTGFTATATGTSTASLSWTAPATLTGYTLSQSPGTLAGCSSAPSSATTSCTATGLSSATTYIWTLTAVYNSWASAPAQASAETEFAATSLGNATGTCVPVVLTCTGPTVTTTDGRSELILIDVQDSGSTSTTVSGITGPFTATSQLASVEYPTATSENYLYAWTGTGDGDDMPVAATFGGLNLSASPSVWIDVVELGSGEAPLACSGCTDGGTTTSGNQNATVQLTVQHSADNEIAFLGSADDGTFAAPSGFSVLAGGGSASYGTYAKLVVASSALFSMGASGLNWGSIGLEIQP